MSRPTNLNPHVPFWVDKDPEQPARWAVFYLDMGTFFTGPGEGWKANEHAEAFASKLNDRFSLRAPKPNKNGRCVVCNDYHDGPVIRKA
jgi:hypothetical protein